MKKLPLRRHPKWKIFVNGYYVYNPIIDWGDVSMYERMMNEDTNWLVELIGAPEHKKNYEHIQIAINSRHSSSVLRRKCIRLLWLHEKKGTV